MSSPSSKATASSLPKITDLRKLLNFGDASSSRAQGFNDIVRAFRRTYRTGTGVPGVDLHDWKSPEHQSELTKMARKFLDEQNYGRIFWPDIEGDAGNSIKLEYSKNQKFITSTMKQLFFRLNQQQFRNKKYKKRDRDGSASLNIRGQSVTDPIQVDDGDSELENGSRSHTPSYPRPSTETLLGDARFEQRERVKEEPRGFARRPSPPRTPRIGRMNPGGRFEATDDDMYNVPSSPEREDRIDYGGKSTSTPPRNRTVHHRVWDPDLIEAFERSLAESSGHPEERHPAKRQKVHEVEPKHGIAEPNEPSPPSSGKRKSARERTQWKKPGYVLAGEIDEALSEYGPPPKAPTHRPKMLYAKTSPKKANASLEKSNPSPGNPGVIDPPRSPTPQNLPQESAPQASGVTELLRQSGPQTIPTNTTAATATTATDPPINQSHEPKEAPKQASRPKPRLNLIYRVVKSREPFFDCEIWNPKGGRFQEKSLEEVLQEIPKTNSSTYVTALIFTLCGPGMRIKDTIERNEESRFGVMKTFFTRQITLCLSKASEQSLLLEMEIEPVYKDEQVKG